MEEKQENCKNIISANEIISFFIKRGPISSIQQGPALKKAIELGILEDVIDGIIYELDNNKNEIAAESLVNLSNNKESQLIIAKKAINHFENKIRYLLLCIINLSLNRNAINIILENSDIIDKIFLLCYHEKINIRKNAIRVISIFSINNEKIVSRIIEKDMIELFMNELISNIHIEFRIDILNCFIYIGRMYANHSSFVNIIPNLCQRIFIMNILPMEQDIISKILINAFKNGNNQVSELIKKNTQEKLQGEKRLYPSMRELLTLF